MSYRFISSLNQIANQIRKRAEDGTIPIVHTNETIRVQQVWFNEHHGCHPQFASPVQFVTVTIPDIQALLRLRPKTSSDRKVHLRVGLSHAEFTRECDDVYHVMQP